MIKTIPDEMINGELMCEHTIELYCPECGRDVDEEELAALKCSDCGASLEDPEQHVAIVVAHLTLGGAVL